MNGKQREYAEKIKMHTKKLGAEYARLKFNEGIDSNKIIVQPQYKLPEQTVCNEDTKIAKSLYHKVQKLNGS